MARNSKGLNKYCGLFIAFIFIFTAVFSLSGCEPLRKKFVRQKKKDKEAAFIPILEPYDYESSVNLSRERYEYHYSLWKAWRNELYRGITEGEMDSRIKYFYGEMIKQLDEMGKWLADEKKTELKEAMREVVALQAEIDKPQVMRNNTSIAKILRFHEKTIRNSFSPYSAVKYSE